MNTNVTAGNWMSVWSNRTPNADKVFYDDVRWVRNIGTNQPPVVSGGANSSAVVNQPVTLTGPHTDDGRPAGRPVTREWSKSSGPGMVAFKTPAAATTEARFGQAGVYVIKYEVSDGELLGYGQRTITVTP